MLATPLTWVEQYSWYHPAQIRFRPHLGTGDSFSSMVLVGGRSHRIQTILALGIRKSYDYVSHDAIVDACAQLPMPSLMSQPLLSAWLGTQKDCSHLPQGTVLASILFTIALLSLAW